MRIKYDGNNGAEIADALTPHVTNHLSRVIVNPLHKGDDLSLSQDFPAREGELFAQTAHDRWRVPLGYEIEVTTGQVFNPDGQIMDYVDLTKE